MAWIKVIQEEEASGELKQLYDQMMESWGGVDILDINQITGYFAFVNRLADGLGVELEPYWDTLA